MAKKKTATRKPAKKAAKKAPKKKAAKKAPAKKAAKKTAKKAAKKTAKKTAKKAAKKLTTKRKIGGRNLSLTLSNGNLSIKAAGMPIDKDQLEELSDLIAGYLNKTKGASSSG